MNIFSFARKNILSVVISTLVSVLFVAASVSAVTTIDLNVNTGGTLTVTGLSSLANASTTVMSTSGNFMVGGRATTTASSGNIETQGTITVGSSGTAITSMVSGVCGLAATTVAASSTAMGSCIGATGILSGDRVFVTATSSMQANFIVQAASSTASNIIQVNIFNTGTIAGTSAGPTALYFWAVR